MGTPRVSETGWVALLRGINVGGKNIVPMADLRRVVEEAGGTDVASYIQSGNLVFRHATADRAALAAHLEEPFGPDNAHTHVSFLEREPDTQALAGLAELDIAPDRIEVIGSNAFLHYPNGVSGSRLTGPILERRLGVPGTVRNWRTVTQLTAMAAAASL